jgi:single-stranded-DNA-specific exonuclease
MKKIVLKQNSINPVSSDYLADYLLTLGVKKEDLPVFMYGPKEEDEGDPFKLVNMERALKTVYDAAEAGKEFFIQVDSDVDGYTSSAIFISYMKSRYPLLTINWRLHNGKEHGIIVDTVPQTAEIVIIPDAGSMQVEEQKELSKLGKTVVILDHHNVEKDQNIENVVLVNNQISPDFNNKALSGAGMVYMFCKAYDKTYFKDKIYNNYADLAALGIIADSMSTKTPGNHAIIMRGLGTIRNSMFQAVLTKQSYSISDISKPNKIDVAYYVAPLINGLIRSGEPEEKQAFFRAMTINNSTERVETDNRGALRSENIYENAARIAANAKSRQEAAKKKGLKFLVEQIEENKLDQNTIIAVQVPERDAYKVDQNMTGLIAMDLVKTYNKPVLVLREKKEANGSVVLAGSGRSKEFDGLLSFMPFIRESGLSNYAEGHGNAFGAFFTKDNLVKFIDYSNTKLAEVDFNNDLIEVDYWFKSMVNSAMLTVFANGSHLYGNGIPQPKFAFDMVLEDKDVVTMGKDGKTLKIVKNGISFIEFRAEETIEELRKNPQNEVTIVGRSQLNNFMGKVNVQVIIDDISIKAATTSTKKQRTVTDLI